jgi:hypothetical protein
MQNVSKTMDTVLHVVSLMAGCGEVWVSHFSALTITSFVR